MNFGLLNPWFLLAAAAAGATVWLHLRRRSEKNLLRFSTLRFLEACPQARASPRRLQDVLLFLLRVLAVCLLAAAFAWPYLKGQGRVAIRESQVYILDNTLSHQAGGGLERARERVAEELRRAPGDVQTAVIELTGQPRVVAGFADDRLEAARRVAELPPSFQRGSYLAAFRQAHTLLSASLGENKRLVFATDSQENQWTENSSAPPFLDNTAVDLWKPAGSNAPNVSLSDPRLQRVFLGEKSLVNFTVNLKWSHAPGRVTVILQANAQTIFSQNLDLTNRSGAMLLQGQWEAEPGLWLQGTAAVRAGADALAGDNSVFFTLPPVQEGKLALLALSPYLRLALSPEIMRGYWETRVLDPASLAAEAAGSRDADVLVIESAYLQSAGARQLVDRYLSNGRGVLLIVNRASPIVSSALRDLGFELLAPGDPAASSSHRLQYVFTSHPVFHPFLSPDYGNLLEVTVRGPARLRALQGMPLVFSEHGEGLLFQGTGFAGRLLVAAFAFDRAQTSWGTHVTFIPFLDLCLQHCRPEDSTPLDYEPGGLCLLSLPPNSPTREVILRQGQAEVARARVAQGRAQFRLPDRPGLYAVHHDADPEPARFLSVNPSHRESDLTYLENPEMLGLWKLERGASGARPGLAPADLSRAAILRQKIWWWLLAAGLAGLLGETVWAAALRRTS